MTVQQWRDTGFGLLTGADDGLRSEVAQEAIRVFLRALGEDPSREGLRETPRRVARAFKELLTPPTVRPTTFDNSEASEQKYDQMILVRDAPFASVCEHHLFPFIGHATVGYVPDGKLLGLSKVVRLLQAASAGLQIQERITDAVADAIVATVSPRGVAVVLVARHTCMEARGVKAHGAETMTSALRGCFLEPAPRAEFFSLVGRRR